MPAVKYRGCSHTFSRRPQQLLEESAQHGNQKQTDEDEQDQNATPEDLPRAMTSFGNCSRTERDGRESGPTRRPTPDRFATSSSSSLTAEPVSGRRLRTICEERLEVPCLEPLLEVAEPWAVVGGEVGLCDP